MHSSETVFLVLLSNSTGFGTDAIVGCTCQRLVQFSIDCWPCIDFEHIGNSLVPVHSNSNAGHGPAVDSLTGIEPQHCSIGWLML